MHTKHIRQQLTHVNINQIYVEHNTYTKLLLDFLNKGLGIFDVVCIFQNLCDCSDLFGFVL